MSRSNAGSSAGRQDAPRGRGRGLRRGGELLDVQVSTTETGSPIPGPSRSPSKRSTPVLLPPTGRLSFPDTTGKSGLSPDASIASRSPSRSPIRLELPTGWTVESTQWLSVANPDSLSADMRVLHHNMSVIGVRMDQLTQVVLSLLGKTRGGRSAADQSGMDDLDEEEKDVLRRLDEIPSDLLEDLLKSFRNHKGGSPLKNQRGNPSAKQAGEFRDFVGNAVAEEAHVIEQARQAAEEMDVDSEAPAQQPTPVADLHSILLAVRDELLAAKYVELVKRFDLGQKLGSASLKTKKANTKTTTAKATGKSGKAPASKKRKGDAEVEGEETRATKSPKKGQAAEPEVIPSGGESEDEDGE